VRLAAERQGVPLPPVAVRGAASSARGRAAAAALG
jgi:hypothetical protein